ncbi:hypothetical protein ACWCV9_04350 [Streptomyces sp. NPDC001606]
MPTTADQLLLALEPLPFPDRLNRTAHTARRLADDGRLTAVLTDLDARGPYERRLAALAAFAGRDTVFLAARLADPDPVVAGYALRAARVQAVPDEAVAAAYDDAPAELRRRLARLLASAGRTALAERLVTRLGAEWGDAEAARLLPACSTPFVARHLPRLAHAVDGWTSLARRHPDPVADHAERALEDRTGAAQRDDWWRVHATTVAALAPRRPERVLALLERFGPAGLPPALYPALGALVTADAERVVCWLASADRREQRHAPVPPPGVLRRLVRAAPESLPRLGRHWLRRQTHFAALLKAMPPGRRPEFLDTVTTGRTLAAPTLAVLGLLPRERRWAEVRRAAAEFGDPADFWDDLAILAHGPFAEARAELLAATRRPDPEDRKTAWALLVACAARDGGRAAVTGLLTEMGHRLPNEQDPVRADALHALAGAHPRLFAPADAESLDRIAQGALLARDCSAATLTALRSLAERVLAEHAGDAALRAGALRTLERMASRVGVPDLGPLHRVLRRGQEHDVFEALRPWLEAAAGRSDFRLLLGLARALGPRARSLTGLQELLATALERGDDPTFEAAAELWLAAPATRADRVARIIAREPSAAVLAPVRRVLARTRTDLLDALLGDTPPYGRFLVPGARRPLPDLGTAHRWLPRQQRAAVRIAGQAAADGSLPSDDRVAALRAAAPVPELGRALALRHRDDPDVPVAEAALAALARTDRPADALPVLLGQASGDRARVAVYAAGRAARYAAPSRLALELDTLLTGERAAKVTSRKEAVRLAARFLPPGRAVDLLSHACRAPGSHPDVRAAALRALPPLLGVPQAWTLLEDAVHDDAPQVRQALVEVSPWELAEGHRARYATLLDAAYDACLASYDAYSGYGMLRTVGTWVRHAPALADRLARTACDLDSRTHWRYAAWVVRDLAASDLPHPVGGAAEGSVFHGAVAELLAALHTPDGGGEALEDRDLPALQRLRTLVEPASDRPERPELLEAVTAQLAPEPLLIAERADLLRRLVDRAVEPAPLLARLRELADALEGAGAAVAWSAAGRLRTDWAHTARAQREGSLLAAADRLARDGGTITGLLATGVVTGTGAGLGWPEEWRALLRRLRRHPDPDVRHHAHQTVTTRE